METSPKKHKGHDIQVRWIHAWQLLKIPLAKVAIMASNFHP